MINPNVVEGQIAGGVVQGIGGVLYEHFVYDADGNPLTTTYLDYLIPTSTEVPEIEYEHLETPAPTNPGGFKGLGEGGAIGAPAAVMNAIADALSPFGVKITAQPLTPPAVLALIDRHRRAEPALRRAAPSRCRRSGRSSTKPLDPRPVLDGWAVCSVARVRAAQRSRTP